MTGSKKRDESRKVVRIAVAGYRLISRLVFEGTPKQMLARCRVAMEKRREISDCCMLPGRRVAGSQQGARSTARTPMLDGLIAKANCPRTDPGLEVAVLAFLRRGGPEGGKRVTRSPLPRSSKVAD